MPAMHGMMVKKYKFHKIKQSDLYSRLHVGIAEFKELNWIPVSECAKQINLCKIYSVVYWSVPKYDKK